jgi:hypothetical protein
LKPSTYVNLARQSSGPVSTQSNSDRSVGLACYLGTHPIEHRAGTLPPIVRLGTRDFILRPDVVDRMDTQVRCAQFDDLMRARSDRHGSENGKRGEAPRKLASGPYIRRVLGDPQGGASSETKISSRDRSQKLRKIFFAISCLQMAADLLRPGRSVLRQPKGQGTAGADQTVGRGSFESFRSHRAPDAARDCDPNPEGPEAGARHRLGPDQIGEQERCRGGGLQIFPSS